MSGPADSAVHCHRLTKRYATVAALDGFDLEIRQGEVLSLLGPSGSGKTTALRSIAGFERPDAGSITIAGTTVTADGVFVAPERRAVGMVFQDYALFPHMTVEGNVGYGLRGTNQAPKRVAELLDLVGLTPARDRMPHELSGGEQQRVALARALAPHPKLVLLDEPFSNLDTTLRDRMRRDVRRILKEAEATAILVTHDQEDALSIADVVAVMKEGRVLQTAPPHVIYRRPATPWIASFVGEAVMLPGMAERGLVTTPLGAFPHTEDRRGEVQVMVRPEWIHPVRASDGVAVVTDQEYYGHDQLLLLEFPDGRRVESRTATGPVINIGDRVDIGVDEVLIFPATGEAAAKD